MCFSKNLVLILIWIRRSTVSVEQYPASCPSEENIRSANDSAQGADRYLHAKRYNRGNSMASSLTVIHMTRAFKLLRFQPVVFSDRYLFHLIVSNTKSPLLYPTSCYGKVLLRTHLDLSCHPAIVTYFVGVAVGYGASKHEYARVSSLTFTF